MAVLGDKENAQIKEELEKLIQKKLPEDRQGRELDSIENINLVHWEVDPANSDRNKITISTLTALPKIWLKNNHGGTSNNNLHLKNNKPVIFEYNEESESYEITNGDDIILFDTSPM
jgi:hypothetical protein